MAINGGNPSMVNCALWGKFQPFTCKALHCFGINLQCFNSQSEYATPLKSIGEFIVTLVYKLNL